MTFRLPVICEFDSGGRAAPSARAQPGAFVLACTLAFACAQPGAAQTPLRCAQLLPADAVKTLLGNPVETTPPKQHEAGESECIWRRGAAPGGTAIAFRFFDRQAIGSNPVTRTIDGYYDMLLLSGEEKGGGKREAVPGVPRAAMIQASPQILVVVQRADGVARIVLTNLNRNQAIAVAKAVAG